MNHDTILEFNSSFHPHIICMDLLQVQRYGGDVYTVADGSEHWAVMQYLLDIARNYLSPKCILFASPEIGPTKRFSLPWHCHGLTFSLASLSTH